MYTQNQINKFKEFFNQNFNVNSTNKEVNSNMELPLYKKGNKIHIKKQNVGKFTQYCNGKVIEECIQRGKNSPNPKIRRRAIFAQNSRRWNPQKK